MTEIECAEPDDYPIWGPLDANLSAPLDCEIRELIHALNTDDVRTTQSCCGHGKRRADIELIVRGVVPFTQLDARLRCIEELAPWVQMPGAARFELRPGTIFGQRSVRDARDRWVEMPKDWLCLSLYVGQGSGNAPPSAALLNAVGDVYRACLDVGIPAHSNDWTAAILKLFPWRPANELAALSTASPDA